MGKKTANRKGPGRISKFNPALTAQIIKHLESGLTDKDTCALVGIGVSTFYEWVQDGRDGGSAEKLEFAEAVTRARGRALAAATTNLVKGMLPSHTTTTTTEQFTETRLDSRGRPYEYRRVTQRDATTTNPGDWRAAVEYLKRRDPAQWADRLVLSLEPDVIDALHVLGVAPSDAYEQFKAIVLDAAAKVRNGQHDNGA